MSDIIRFTCRACGKKLKAPRELLGRRVKCSCGESHYVPNPKPEAKGANTEPEPVPKAQSGELTSPRQHGTLDPPIPAKRRNLLGWLSLLIFVTAGVLCVVAPIRDPFSSTWRTVIVGICVVGVIFGALSYIRHRHNLIGGIAIALCLSVAIFTSYTGWQNVKKRWRNEVLPLSPSQVS